jgi:hypothetical protein
MKIKVLSVVVLMSLLISNAYAYGPQGHSMVGAIADRRLAKANKPVAGTVNKLLDGITLERAARLPDDIKSWDKTPPHTNDEFGKPAFALPDHPQIEAQLIAFWKANRASFGGQTLHRVFHFTDVPAIDDVKYSDGKTGRTQFDIVHMIPACIDVLTGKVSEDNPRKITKPIAIILLAHYVGDIHQPLHVGAEYFDATGNPVNPDKGGKGFGDEGGNTLDLFLRGAGAQPHPVGQLHGYWDNDAFLTALGIMQSQFQSAHPTHKGQITNAELAQGLADSEPAGWKLSPPNGLQGLAEAWANEILPLARQAHQRLRFKVHLANNHGAMEASGQAEEISVPGVAYEQWAGTVVESEIHKAGWRLAALLEQTVH